MAFEDELRERRSETDISSSEEIGCGESTSGSDDQFSDDYTVRSSPNIKETGASDRSKTTRKMFGQETSEEVAAGLLQCYQETLNNLAQKMLVKDVHIDKFQGRDNEDISRWFEKLELLLTTHVVLI